MSLINSKLSFFKIELPQLFRTIIRPYKHELLLFIITYDLYNKHFNDLPPTIRSLIVFVNSKIIL